MVFRAGHLAIPAWLSLLALGCAGNKATVPANSAEDPPEQLSEEETDVEPEEPEQAQEPAFANHARQSLRASEPPRNTLGLGLVVAQRGVDLPWLVVIANQSEQTATVAGDMRLLRLRVEKPAAEGAKKSAPQSAVCELPSSDRPSQVDKERLVELEPGMMLVQAFDPRLYCEPDVLAPGALVTPEFGWPVATRTVWRQGRRIEEPTEQKEPFVAVHQGDGSDRLEPVKQLEGEPFTLDDSYAAPPPPSADPDEPPPLELYVKNLGTLTEPRESNVTIEIKNPARQGRRLFFRRELVTYEVIGPHGTTTCAVYPNTYAPDRQSYELIAAGGTMRVVSRLAELCPPEAFGPPGLYRVHARLDANHSGQEHDIEAFVGVVTTREPALLRIRGGKPAPMWLLPIRSELNAASDSNAAPTE